MLPINSIVNGDNLTVMKTFPDNCIDAIVTDPPYALVGGSRGGSLSIGDKTTPFGRSGPSKNGVSIKKGFMGKEWDGKLPGIETWEEALRVAKPGAHMLAFGGSRTHHRLMVAIEDAGWELRDCAMFLYGSGFPKSMDVSKAIDKAAGVEREVVGKGISGNPQSHKTHNMGNDIANGGYEFGGEFNITAPATDAAKQWNGWGTALKPAWEPVILFRKPLDGTIANNVIKWGCGSLNIDACRIAHKEPTKNTKRVGRKEADVWSDNACGFDNEKNTVASADPKGRFPANLLLDNQTALMLDEQSGVSTSRVGNPRGTTKKGLFANAKFNKVGTEHDDTGGASRFFFNATDGRFPANLILDEEAAELLDIQTGILKSGDNCTRTKTGSFLEHGGLGKPGDVQVTYGDEGGASRFFYCAKASRSERNAGLDDIPEKEVPYSEYRDNFKDTKSYVTHYPDGTQRPVNKTKNAHPTVKPLTLMRYLCRLVTPPRGIVLDPFAGSGSTCIAAVQEGFNYIGIEMETEYVEIANKRIAYWSKKV